MFKDEKQDSPMVGVSYSSGYLGLVPTLLRITSVTPGKLLSLSLKVFGCLTPTGFKSIDLKSMGVEQLNTFVDLDLSTSILHCKMGINSTGLPHSGGGSINTS